VFQHRPRLTNLYQYAPTVASVHIEEITCSNNNHRSWVLPSSCENATEILTGPLGVLCSR